LNQAVAAEVGLRDGVSEGMLIVENVYVLNVKILF